MWADLYEKGIGFHQQLRADRGPNKRGVVASRQALDAIDEYPSSGYLLETEIDWLSARGGTLLYNVTST